MRLLIEPWIAASRTPFRRVAPGLAVWEIDEAGMMRPSKAKAASEAKRELLSYLLRSGVPLFLVYSEDPADDALEDAWALAREETWRVPPDADPKRLLDWLFLGGWFLYTAEAALDPQLLSGLGFAAAATDVDAFLRRHQLGFLVVAFHDNDPWIVAERALSSEAP